MENCPPVLPHRAMLPRRWLAATTCWSAAVPAGTAADTSIAIIVSAPSMSSFAVLARQDFTNRCRCTSLLIAKGIRRAVAEPIHSGKGCEVGFGSEPSLDVDNVGIKNRRSSRQRLAPDVGASMDGIPRGRTSVHVKVFRCRPITAVRQQLGPPSKASTEANIRALCDLRL
jgi:hypothetical protein